MSTVDCETSEEYFYDSEQSTSEASEDSLHSANEEFFLSYDERTDVRFQLIILSTNCLKFLFLAILFELFGGSSRHKGICLYNDCSSGASCSKSG